MQSAIRFGEMTKSILQLIQVQQTVYKYTKASENVGGGVFTHEEMAREMAGKNCSVFK